MNINIKQETDPTILTRLNKTVQNYHATAYPNVFLPYDYERLLPWFEDIVAKENVWFLVAYDNNNPIGYALLILKKGLDNPFQKDDYRAMLIDQMSVNEDYQSKGIGTKLMEAALAFSKEQEVSKVQLTVWQDNKKAIEFYQKLGFQTYMNCFEILL